MTNVNKYQNLSERINKYIENHLENVGYEPTYKSVSELAYDIGNKQAITDLQNQVQELVKQNDMNQLIINGMRGVVAMARAANNQNPDLRVTHQLKRFDQNKLSDYRDKQVETLQKKIGWYESAVHTCHNECQKPMCVMSRENKALKEQIKVMSDNCISLSLHDSRMANLQGKIDMMIVFMKFLENSGYDLRPTEISNWHENVLKKLKE